jgi:hypothetical protein
MLDLFIIFVLRNMMFERNFKTELRFEREKIYFIFGIQLNADVPCHVDKNIGLGTKLNLPAKV